MTVSKYTCDRDIWVTMDDNFCLVPRPHPFLRYK